VSERTNQHEPAPGTWTGWLLPAGFLLVAAALVADPFRAAIPIGAPAAVDRAMLIVGPGRIAMADPPHIMVEGQPQACNGCHQIFASQHPAGTPLSYHQDLTLSHGMNDRCANCHDAQDRERLTLRDGTTVFFAQTPLLCAQCHGTAYRDWQRGTHGKTLGSWMTGSTEQRRLSCNECHNPHAPRFDAIPPLPGPRTLRMGEPHAEAHHHGGASESPLQRVIRAIDAADASHHGAQP
jgi:hypothetical protein